MEERVSDSPNVDSIDEKKDVVAYETYQKLLAQRKSDQAKLAEYNERLEKLSEYEKRIEQQEEEKAKAEGNWKALIESREAKAKEFETKYQEAMTKVSSFEQSLNDAKKIRAFEDAIGGKLIDRDYYNLIDLDSIALDPESGEIDKDSLKKTSESFVKKHKILVNFKKPYVDSREGNPSSTMTLEEWQLLAKKDPKKALAERHKVK
jgi:predicted RNase H-like nuclease (RuvC/YqgF family)